MQETLTEKWVITRKPHKCYGCLRTFSVGTEITTSKDGLGMIGR